MAGAAYAGEVARWIQAFKYPSRGIAGLDPRPGAIARELVREAAMRAPAPPPDRVVPVPLHPRRLRARGFSAAALLAREVAAARGARVAFELLSRTRDTPSQTGLSRPERARNVRAAFSVAARVESVVWLVDDVVTTGATVSECARALRARGARRVVAVCAARTPLADPTSAG